MGKVSLRSVWEDNYPVVADEDDLKRMYACLLAVLVELSAGKH